MGLFSSTRQSHTLRENKALIWKAPSGLTKEGWRTKWVLHTDDHQSRGSDFRVTVLKVDVVLSLSLDH